MMSKLAMAAKKVIDAAWLHGTSYDLSSQAAVALESAQLLQSPETAAELDRLRERSAAAPIELTTEQRAAIAAHLAEVKPASTALVADLAKTVRDVRVHEHPKGEDLYCLNLLSYMGERMGPVLRRLLDAEARIAELEKAAEPTHQGPDPSHGGLTTHRGRREDCSGPDCELADEAAAPPADGITQRLAPTQALREPVPDDSPAALLAQALRDHLPEVVSVDVQGRHTLRVTVRPKTLDDWAWYIARFQVDLATVTARGSFATATGRRKDVTIRFIAEGLPALWAAKVGESQ